MEREYDYADYVDPDQPTPTPPFPDWWHGPPGGPGDPGGPKPPAPPFPDWEPPPPPPPPPTLTPAVKPTARFPEGQRPPSPGQGAVWNDDWWDGQSDFLGGWLIPDSVPPGGPGGPTPPPGGPNTGGTGQFDYGSPERLPFSDYRELEPFKFSGGPFSYADFKPSSWADAQNEPGFAESEDRLSKMVQNSAAYRGVLRSGMTIGDLSSVLNTNKGQNFQQFDTRNFRNWGANYDKSADAWTKNLGNEQWAYGQKAGENTRFNTDRFNKDNTSFADRLSRWGQLVAATTQLARPV